MTVFIGCGCLSLVVTVFIAVGCGFRAVDSEAEVFLESEAKAVGGQLLSHCCVFAVCASAVTGQSLSH